MKKLVGVFGPANCKAGGKLYGAAEELGRLLAEASFAIVTGGYEGVMEAASKGARSANGSAIGVTAEVYFAKGREANTYLTREVRVKSAADRLMELLDLPDAFIAIGNSTGTLAEVAMAWDYMTKGFLPPKPLLLVGNSWNGFADYVAREDQFRPYLQMIEHLAIPEHAVRRLTELFGTQPRLPDLDILQR